MILLIEKIIIIILTYLDCGISIFNMHGYHDGIDIHDKYVSFFTIKKQMQIR